jgi:hypothetical protein
MEYKMNEYNYPYVFNPGMISGKIPETLFRELVSFYTLPTAKETPLENTSFKYHLPFNDGLNDYLQDMYSNWCKAFEVEYTVMDLQVWSQILNKNDYVSLESHKGSAVSFILWIQIPDKGEKLVLTYSQYNGSICNNPIEIDKSYQGTMIMFPAGISYSVFPRVEEREERIAICGYIATA